MFVYIYYEYVLFKFMLQICILQTYILKVCKYTLHIYIMQI